MEPRVKVRYDFHFVFVLFKLFTCRVRKNILDESLKTPVLSFFLDYYKYVRIKLKV